MDRSRARQAPDTDCADPRRAVLGSKLRQLRHQRQISCRRFAAAVGLDPSYYARIESGRAAPPSLRVLTRIADRLGIVAESQEWRELIDREALTRGRIPQDLLDSWNPEAMLAFFAALRIGLDRDQNRKTNAPREQGVVEFSESADGNRG